MTVQRKNHPVATVAVPKQPNVYVPPECMDSLEAASPAAGLPPRSPSFYAASLGNAYVSPIRPASQGRYVPSHFASQPESSPPFGRTESGEDSIIASSSSGTRIRSVIHSRVGSCGLSIMHGWVLYEFLCNWEGS